MENKAEKHIERLNILNLHIEQGQKIVKSNALIQKSRYSLSAQDQKIILYLISKIEPTDEELKYYEFDMKIMCDLCGIDYTGQNYKNFKDTIQDLSNKSFWVRIDNKDILCRWIEKVIIDYSTSTTKLYIRLDDTLKPYLLQIKNNYTIYELSNVLTMKSKYSIRLYELFKSYYNLRYFEISVDELKKMLNVENKYTDYKNFRVNVIDKSIEEINSTTDLQVSYTPIRNNRVITHLHFSITATTMDDVIENLKNKARAERDKQ